MQSHMTRLWGLQHLDSLITGYHEVYFVRTHVTPKFVWVKVYVVDGDKLADLTLFLAAVMNRKTHQRYGGIEMVQDGYDAGETICMILAREVNPQALKRPFLKRVWLR